VLLADVPVQLVAVPEHQVAAGACHHHQNLLSRRRAVGQRAERAGLSGQDVGSTPPIERAMGGRSTPRLLPAASKETIDARAAGAYSTGSTGVVGQSSS
jgi:hypothetical protein